MVKCEVLEPTTLVASKGSIVLVTEQQYDAIRDRVTLIKEKAAKKKREDTEDAS